MACCALFQYLAHVCCNNRNIFSSSRINVLFLGTNHEINLSFVNGLKNFVEHHQTQPTEGPTTNTAGDGEISVRYTEASSDVLPEVSATISVETPTPPPMEATTSDAPGESSLLDIPSTSTGFSKNDAGTAETPWFTVENVRVSKGFIELITTRSILANDVLDIFIQVEHRGSLQAICVVLDEYEQPSVTAELIERLYCFISGPKIKNVFGVHLGNSDDIRRAIQQTKEQVQNHGFQFPTFYPWTAEGLCTRLSRNKQLGYILKHIFSLKSFEKRPYIVAWVILLLKLTIRRLEKIQTEIGNLEDQHKIMVEGSPTLTSKDPEIETMESDISSYICNASGQKVIISKLVPFIRQNVANTAFMTDILANVDFVPVDWGFIDDEDVFTLLKFNEPELAEYAGDAALHWCEPLSSTQQTSCFSFYFSFFYRSML